MKTNIFAQTLVKSFGFAVLLFALFFAATHFAQAQSAVKPEIKQLFVAIDRKDLTEFNNLIAAGVDLTETYGDSKPTALHQAAATGTPEMVKILLTKIYINERDANSRTALFYATVGKNLATLKALARAGADVEQKDSTGATFDQYADDAQIKQYIASSATDTARMWQALKTNDAATALRLVTAGSASPNALLDKQTPLIFAAAKNDAVLFDKILNAGGDVSTFVAALFPPHRTALDAAAENGNADLVKKILTKDLGARKAGILGNALAAAIRGGRNEIVPILLQAGANVNEGYDLTTPIRAAVTRGDAALLKSLIAKGATKKTLGRALDAAVAAPNSAAVFQILLDAGADVNENLIGFSALTAAAEKGNIGVLKLLTDKGANKENIQSAFIVAAEKNQINSLRFLMSLPAKPDLNNVGKSPGSSTALIGAATNDAFEAVRFLVARGADINLIARDGLELSTALISTARKGNSAMVNLLLQLGANPKIAVNTDLLDDSVIETALNFAANKPEILKLLQNPPSAEQVAKNVQFVKFMMSAGDFAAAEKYSEALAEYNRALEVYPDSNSIYFRQIPLMITLKDFASAEQTAGKALAICQKPQAQCSSTTFAETHNFRVVALIRQQKFEDALPDANKAVEFCTKGEKPCSFLGSTYNNRGVIHREQKRFTEAVADLTKAIEAMPDTARPYFHRAKTYLLLGDRQKAQTDLTKAKSLGAEDEEIQNFQLPALNAVK